MTPMSTSERAQKEPRCINYAGLRDDFVGSDVAWPQPNSSYRRKSYGLLPLGAPNVTHLRQVDSSINPTAQTTSGCSWYPLVLLCLFSLPPTYTPSDEPLTDSKSIGSRATSRSIFLAKQKVGLTIFVGHWL